MTREEKLNGIASAIQDMCGCGECDGCEFFDPEDRTDGEHWCAVRDSEDRVPHFARWNVDSALWKEEQNNGWILCEERMPKENESMFAKLKGTDNWCNGMFEKASDMVLVTLVGEEGNAITTYAHTMDGKWSCSLLKLNLYKVVAWQPLPAPYNQNETREQRVRLGDAIQMLIDSIENENMISYVRVDRLQEEILNKAKEN